MHTLLCVCPPREESLFPPVLFKSCNQIPQAFKVWFSRNSSSCCHAPRLGSLTWGSELLLQWVDFCGISVLQSVSHPPSSYGILFYCDCTLPTISLWLLLCLWMWGIFLVSSSVFLLMIVQQLVVILVFSQEGVGARPSTPPSWFRVPHILSVIYVLTDYIWRHQYELKFSLNYRYSCLQIEIFIHIIYSLVSIFPCSVSWWHVQLFRMIQIIETNTKGRENMNSLISIREIEIVIWKFHPCKTLVLMASLFLKVLHNFFHKKEEIFAYSFYEVSITLIPKPD